MIIINIEHYCFICSTPECGGSYEQATTWFKTMRAWFIGLEFLFISNATTVEIFTLQIKPRETLIKLIR